MLYLVLVLVVASLGLLIAALTTANTLWAWVSVLISVVAAVLLVLDWTRNRRRRSQAAPAAEPRPDPAAEPVPDLLPDAVREEPPPPTTQPDQSEQPAQPGAAGPATAAARPPGEQLPGSMSDSDFDESFEAFEKQLREMEQAEPPAFGEPPSGPVPAQPEPVTAVQQPVLDEEVEPQEENTDATDLLVVSELQDEVVVIDERPRYHLATCAWLGGRPVLKLPVSEARDLGFTPCGSCAPDSTLAARQRARS